MSLFKSEYYPPLEILLLGEYGVGKTSLLLSFIDGVYPETHNSDIGVAFKIKMFDVDGQAIKLRIWDFKKDRSRIMDDSHIRGSHGFILCFDLTNMKSLERLKKWIQDINKYFPTNSNIIIVGTKSDLVCEREVDFETGKSFADQMDYPYIECSSKDNFNVIQVFTQLSQEVLKKKRGFLIQSNNTSDEKTSGYLQKKF